MFFHLLDLSIVNACALEKKVWNKKKVEVVVFQLDLKSERELKIQSRLFPMMVLEMRLCFCVIETNISRHVPKYTPCLTMTWDETTLLKHLHSVANNKNNVISDFVEITISLDFKRWNYYW
jgi:hypothetical protein